jgi:dipeptide/tripeptide permease
VFATSVPSEFAEPHGRSSFAPIEEIGDPIHDKDLKIYDGEAESPVEGEHHVDDPSYPRPTEEERSTLRRVADKIPAASFVLCAVEFSERASYYGVTQVWSNFMQFPLPAGGNGAGATPKGTQETAGALGRGLQFANAFTLLFTFLAYVIPIFGAWIADTRLGRYKTIAIGVLICGISHVIIIFGALPSVLQAGHGTAPFMISYFILAFGAGK